MTFKTPEENNLRIRGEIDSKYSSDSSLNTVTLKVIYYPRNPILPARILIDNEQAVITEMDAGNTYSTAAAYMFNNDFPMMYDGENRFLLTAYDKVGNFADLLLMVDNTITTILFPEKGNNIRYAPMVLVGEINNTYNVDMDIFLSDPLVPDTGEDNFAMWHKAKLNEDYTFFIEDIYANPGTISREAHTPLTMAVRMKSGKIFYKNIDVWANEIIMPIEMTLSTHAVEGESADTELVI